ncbi:hypothetical protein [Streptomyces chromofuscus]|uniref:UDP-N-acetylmuramyl pentapeptide phosphotransferase/UDP-N-acetylglucosamine-1-phosphate transferase n=1 Tax=Streptomyces chromofuscus TaxID=42881 RepID=A0A7M2TCJ1_STRCW|nr:hypothetical protein [Streptomyces chromofuscus]QOV45859.1 hypothetical protein IPT68_08080 [Streptomyces chromofuscus]GGT18495.1 hypothetical protein GCM10010254_43960 [Streptomyces chromofuscus]
MIPRSGRVPRTASVALTAALARAALTALRATAPGGRERWERRNHAGRTVGLHAGPATALATAVGVGRISPLAGAALIAVGGCGAYDDVAGDHRRGFRAHLAALREGEVTSGAVKLFGIGAAGLLAGAVLKERPVDKVLAGIVIAGAAHFVNLVDVRPGRAAGAVVALAVPGLLCKEPGAAESAAAVLGAAGAVLPEDLGERVMLGDTGAHALGAALGVVGAVAGGRAGLVGQAVGVVVAAVCGDRVSGLARSLG